MAEAQIVLRGLEKVYRVHEREAGMGASIRSLFQRKYKDVRAVDSVRFTVKAGRSRSYPVMPGQHSACATIGGWHAAYVAHRNLLEDFCGTVTLIKWGRAGSYPVIPGKQGTPLPSAA